MVDSYIRTRRLITGVLVTSFVLGIGLGGWIVSALAHPPAGWTIALAAAWAACAGAAWIITQKLIRTDEDKRRGIQKKLEDAQAFYHEIIKSSPDGITLTTLQGEVIFISDRIYELYGFTDPADVAGHLPIEFVAPKDQERALTNIRNVFQDIDTTDNQYTLVRKDGTTFTGEITASLLRDAVGDPAGMIAVTRDISSRLQAEQTLRENEARVHSLFENMLEGYLLCQVVYQDGQLSDWIFEETNPAFHRLTSIPEVVGKSLETVLPGYFTAHPEQAAIITRVIATGRPEQLEALYPEYGKWLSATLYRAGSERLAILFSDISERKRAEATLRESEERYRTLVDQAADAVYLFDSTGRFLEVNSRACDNSGYTQSELLGLSFADMEQDYPAETVITALANQSPCEPLILSGRHRRKDGTVFPVEMHYAPLTYKGQALMMGLVHDITARKQAEAAIQALNASLEARVSERTAELTDIYDNAPVGYHSLAADGTILKINDTELRWLGYTREELVGIVKFPDLLTDDSLPIFMANFAGFKERGWINGLELNLKRKDGTILPMVANATAIYDSNGVYLKSRSTMMDITDRKRAEKATDLLYQSQKRHTAEVEQSNRELEAFAYSISHDLRAPLRAINGYSEIIQNEYWDKLGDEGKRYLAAIAKNANLMGEEINDLLDLSRVGRTEIHAAGIDMTGLIESVLEEIATPEVKNSFEFILNPLPGAWGDVTLMRHVWSNLISNAVKYTTPMPLRRIEIRGAREDEHVVYSIRDTGVGFDPAFSERLFGIFQRLHPASEFEGTGVGLAIAKRIVNRHGGEVWAESRVNEGATFYFSLPVREEEERNHSGKG